MVNAWCYPLLCIKQIFNPNISTSMYRWSEYSTTHHPGIPTYLLWFLNIIYIIRIAYSVSPHFPPKTAPSKYYDMEFIFSILVSSQKFIIPFIDARITSFPRNPWKNPITLAAAKQYIYPFWVFTSLFHSMYHPTNRSFTISLVTPKYCFLINPINSLDHMIFPNHAPRVRQFVSVDFIPTLYENDVTHYQHFISIYIGPFRRGFCHDVPL